MNRQARRRASALTLPAEEPSAEALDRLVSGLAAATQQGLPRGWDVTLVCTRHAGDGRAQTRMASTLPPAVRDAVLVGLSAALKGGYDGGAGEPAAEREDDGS